MRQKWLQEGNGITSHNFKTPNLGNQGQINTISIQIGMRAIGKLRISMCCTLMCFLSWCTEAYDILGIVEIE